MTKKDEEACGACCLCIVVLTVIGALIIYWYITLPIALVGGCIYLLAKKKSNQPKKISNRTILEYQLRETHFIEYPKDSCYEDKCPHCLQTISIIKNYPLIGKEIRRLQCPKCHMSLIPIEYYSEKCTYCGEIMIKNQNICSFCGRYKRPIEVIEKRRRNISTQVKREVWRRDYGKCVECGSKERLEYDHIIPFSKGGSNTARNIQLLCEDCNRKKSSNIE